MYAEILGHQLKGIMLHSDIYTVAAYNGYSRLKWCHCFQLRAELDTHIKTIAKAIDDLNAIVEPKPQERIKVPHDATPNQLLDMWEAWERETAELYAKAMTMDECRMWRKLYKDAQHELISIGNMI